MMTYKEKINILMQNYSDLEMDNMRLMHEIQEKDELIDKILKLLYLYGHPECTVSMVPKWVIDEMYEKNMRGYDIDLNAYNMMAYGPEK